MIEGIPRISVYIITYNQEDVIDRTLNSILCQKDYVYEICVSDDCSTDRTWKILNDYSIKYPGLFKLHRNEKNLGIFENTENVWTMPTGDIVYDLAGDDTVNDGWFKSVVEYIISRGIDYKRELFCIYGDYQRIYPNGDKCRNYNSVILRTNESALRLSIRQLISSRATCYSINILRRFRNYSVGRSHIVEDIQDRQLQIYSQYNYYIPVLGNTYFAKRGISVHMTDEMIDERLQIIPFTLSRLADLGIHLSSKDIYFCKYRQAIKTWSYQKKLLFLFKAIWFWCLSFDVRLSISKTKFKELWFAIIRRLPHNEPYDFK